MARQRYSPEQVASALTQGKGLVTVAARLLGCVPNTVQAYIDRYPKVAEARAVQREAVTDLAELALYKAIQEGEAWAVCFYLKTQGKDRGYVERQALDVRSQHLTQVELTVSESTRLLLEQVEEEALIHAVDALLGPTGPGRSGSRGN